MLLKIIFHNRYKLCFCLFILLFNSLNISCSMTKSNNIYEKQIIEKGVLIHLQEYFYFFPLKNKKIHTIEDILNQKKINQLDGFRCEIFLDSIDTYGIYMSMKHFDAAIYVCEYEEKELPPYYIETDDFRISLIEMTYEVRPPIPADKMLVDDTIAHCITILNNHTIKFKNNYISETVYNIKILD